MKNIIYVATLLLSMTHFSNVISMEMLIKNIGSHANKKAAKQLLQEGLNVNEKGFLNYPMLIHAMTYLHETDGNQIPEQKRLAFIEFLLQNGAELEPQTKEWQAVPMLAAQSSKIAPQIIALLKEYGANINITHSYNGMTALHLAAWNGHRDVVKFLLTQDDIQIDIQDNEGETPLTRAAFWGHADIVQMLVDKGARKDTINHAGKSALDYAKIESEDYKAGRQRTMAILLS